MLVPVNLIAHLNLNGSINDQSILKNEKEKTSSLNDSNVEQN